MNKTMRFTAALSAIVAIMPILPGHCEDAAAPPPAETSAPPAAATPPPVITTPASTLAPLGAAANSTDKVRDLNPAFIISGEIVRAAIEKGKKLAHDKKSARDVAKLGSQNPSGVRGKKGKSHESHVFFMGLNAFDIIYDSYLAAANYDPDTTPEWLKTGGSYRKQLEFRITLESVPRVTSSPFESNRAADIGDVRVTKFVLTDDKDHVIPAVVSDSRGGIKSGSMVFSGVNSLSHTETSNTHVDANATGHTNATVHAYDNSGGYANATGTADTRATGSADARTTRTWTEYVPWSAKRPYYSARYRVWFPLFDKDGNALITADAKVLTLHIITENSEMITEYKLEPPKL